MPIYEYICDDCGTQYEKIVMSKAQKIACPKCASKKNKLQLSVFATSTGSANGASAKSGAKSNPRFSGGRSGCGGGGCGCH
jgi:putative FmdB family regulatory protein